jgi:hypothetical protein
VPNTSRSQPRGALWFVVGVSALLFANWLYAIARFQPNVLFMDQWDFLLPLFNGGGWWDRFAQQHGPHRQGLSFLITSWILEATRWDARYDSVWIATALFAAALLALRLKWKMTGAIRWADAWIPILVLSLAQFETVLSTPNASVGVFPLALILLAANVWLAPTSAARYLPAGAIAFALTFTGFGMFGAVALAVLLASRIVRDGIRRDHEAAWMAVGGLAIAVAGWIAFFDGYVFTPAVEGFRFPWTPWTDYLRFIVLMLVLPTGEIGDRWPHYLLGTALALAILVSLALVVSNWGRRDASPRDDVVMLLMGSGVSFVIATAIGRVSLGILGGTTPRYVTLMCPIWLGLFLAAATARRRRVYVATSVCVWILALAPYIGLPRRPVTLWPGTLGLTEGQVETVTLYGTSKAGWARTYLDTGSWEAAQAAVPATMHPDPVNSKLEEKLRFLRDRRLSFFSEPRERCDYLPWLADEAFLNRALGSSRPACR